MTFTNRVDVNLNKVKKKVMDRFCSEIDQFAIFEVDINTKKREGVGQK